MEDDQPRTYRMYAVGSDVDVMGGPLSEEDVYVKTYGVVVVGRHPRDLDVGESCTKEYALSGQRPTRYRITRES